jgi:hypothetical protein
VFSIIINSVSIICDRFYFHEFGWATNYVFFSGFHHNTGEICDILGDGINSLYPNVHKELTLYTQKGTDLAV